MTGYNGWSSAVHAEKGITALHGDGLKLRLEYSSSQTAVTMTDERAPHPNRCTCIRTDRATGSVYIGTGPTQRAAGEAALAAMASGSAAPQTR